MGYTLKQKIENCKKPYQLWELMNKRSFIISYANDDNRFMLGDILVVHNITEFSWDNKTIRSKDYDQELEWLDIKFLRERKHSIDPESSKALMVKLKEFERLYGKIDKYLYDAEN